MYTYKIDATDSFGHVATQAIKSITIDTTPPSVNTMEFNLAPFKPTGLNTTILSYSLSEKSVITASIYNSSNGLIKVLAKLTQNAGANTVSWNGKDGRGYLVPAGTYTVKITAVDAVGNLNSSFKTLLVQ